MAKVRLRLSASREALERALVDDDKGGGIRLTLKVRPGARREQLGESADGALHLDVSAPPVDGKANARVLRLVAHLFDVRASQCRIVRGETARDKQLAVAGLSRAEALARADRLRG